MPEYRVVVTEMNWHRPVTVEAESADNAKEVARDLWDNGHLKSAACDLRFNVSDSDGNETYY